MKKQNFPIILVLFLFVFSTGLVIGDEELIIEIECPDEVESLSEFECTISLNKEDITLDFRITIRGEQIINQIWKGESWERSDHYYQKAIINQNKKVAKIKLHRDFVGTAKGEFWIRNGNSQKITDFKIKILEKQDSTSEQDSPQDESPENGQEDKDSEKETEAPEDTENQEKQDEQESQELVPLKINLNTASVEELTELPSVGEARARSIIELRPFCSIDELEQISGISNGTVEAIKNQGLAYVDPCETQQEKNETESEANKSSQTESIQLTRQENQEDSGTENVIKLTRDESSEGKEGSITGNVVYQSKTENIRRYAIYFFTVFLIGLIFLILKK